MNAESLIARVTGIVVAGTGFTGEEILAKLNAAQLAIAERVLLPGLAGGVATITTTVGAMYADLPDTYHRHLYLAENSTISARVHIYDNIGMMASSLGFIPSIANDGDVTAITVHSGRILYQRVPATPQGLAVMFYRRPVPMEDSDTSFPDGLGGSLAEQEEVFDTALIHHAAWKCFEIIEQGMEGRKIDTEYHKGLFDEAMMNLNDVCRPELVLRYPAINRCW